jgi:1,4-alpha-glucan branching enzyme
MQTGLQLGHIILSEFPPKAPAPPPVSQAIYGVNSFSKKNVFSYQEDLACFVLPAHGSAKSVFLSGSFNQWSTMQLPMLKTDTGWTACIVLPPGKHLYKYIVDGRWVPDPNNKLKENDGHRGHNSVVFCYNHTFKLQGYKDARRVNVAGSFNDWNRRELQMKKTAVGWMLPIYLREGTHTYKYIVDGNWITDPANPVTRWDGAGNLNAVVGIGDTMIFKLRRYENAERVVLSGSFNNWNTAELLMEKSGDEWRLPYVLAAGNYAYKFIVDGRWITDPMNPFSTGTGDFINSFLAFKPNHLFELATFADASEVIVTGSFNDWSHNDYRMVFRDGEWVFPIYLNPGRHSYKFIVDGEWILDPTNPLWEENEFGSGNSVLWVE